ncbi:MAG: hypothetical protein QXT73_00530 [Candidatus Methanomethylicaceae archaeon]
MTKWRSAKSVPIDPDDLAEVREVLFQLGSVVRQDLKEDGGEWPPCVDCPPEIVGFCSLTGEECVGFIHWSGLGSGS